MSRDVWILFVVAGNFIFSVVTVLSHFDDDIPHSHKKPLYIPPVVKGNVYLAEAFASDAEYKQRWILSQAKKDFTDDKIAKYDGVWSLEEPKDILLMGDRGLVLKSKAKHHAISVKLNKPFRFDGKPLVVQYEVKFQKGMDCGGAYIKLLSHSNNLDLEQVTDRTPYTIMFGPDKCGNDYKVHFIFQHRNPLKNSYEEKHAKKSSAGLDTYFTEKQTRLYTLIVYPNNTYEIYVDQIRINQGSLVNDVSPPVNPPKEIIDANETKPVDWDDRKTILDPDAVKPDDWDDREFIPDTNSIKPKGWLDDELYLIPDRKAKKPIDWDNELDGDWEPPMISNPKCDVAPGCGEWISPKVKNPKCKGKWSPPLMPNPNYKGDWSPRMIPNPNYFFDPNPYKMAPIGALGLELWAISNDILFDNFIITDDKKVADQWANDSWALKNEQELAAILSERGIGHALLDAIEERPWLLVVLIFVVIIPVFFFIVCCCASNPKDEATLHKKTDSHQSIAGAASPKINHVLKEDAVTEYRNVLQTNEDATRTIKRKGKSTLETSNLRL